MANTEIMSGTSFSLTSSDGLNFYVKEWSVEKPKAVLALVHGLGEHIDRYDHLAAFFNSNGIAVEGFDHRGHGQSGGKRGHSPSVEAMLGDIDLLLADIGKKYKDVPVFLYGHSMGGNLVLNHTLRKKSNIVGTIATGPWIQLALKPSAFMVGLGKLFRNILPGLTQPNGLDVNHISTDPEEVEKYANDPLVHDKISTALGMGLMDSGNWLNEYKAEPPIPMLIMHGGGDQITSAPASESFALRLGSKVSFKKWDGLYHEIHNEKIQEEIFQYTLDWLNGVV